MNEHKDTTKTEHPESWNDRTLRLLGEESVDRLSRASVLVVGVGGVGGYAAEMLVRSGVGKLTLIDADSVAPSNLNRQLIATQHHRHAQDYHVCRAFSRHQS